MPFVFAHDKISIEYIKPLERELSMRIRITKARSGDCFVVDFENGHCILIGASRRGNKPLIQAGEDKKLCKNVYRR